MHLQIKPLIIIIVIILTLSPSLAFGDRYRHELESARAITGIVGYTKYENPKYKISFEYPKNWEGPKEKEITDGKGRLGWFMVDIFGPLDLKTGLGCSALSLWIISAAQANTESLEEYIQKSILARSIGKANIISDRETMLAGQRARQVSISYKTKRPMGVINPLEITSQLSWVVTFKNNYFYDLLYVSSKADYPLYMEAYEKAKQSLAIY